jgi:hypothetical protein
VSPPAYWPHGSPRGRWCRRGSDARRSSANVRHPAAAQVQRHSHSCLTACPAPRRPDTRRGGWWDAPSARAASLASSAALPRSPGGSLTPAQLGDGDPYVNGYVNPYVIPYALGVRTPDVGGRGDLSSSDAPRGVVRPGRKVRFARSIHRPVRVLGGPAVRAACGGTLSLTWLPRRVVPEGQRGVPLPASTMVIAARW